MALGYVGLVEVGRLLLMLSSCRLSLLAVVCVGVELFGGDIDFGFIIVWVIS